MTLKQHRAIFLTFGVTEAKGNSIPKFNRSSKTFDFLL